MNAQTIVIFSSNAPAHRVMEELMKYDIKFDVVLGSYKGIKETSYITELESWDKVSKSGLFDDQESILLLTDSEPVAPEGLPVVINTMASLQYLKDNTVEDIGVVISTTKEKALAEEGFSYIPSQGRYLIIVPNPQ